MLRRDRKSVFAIPYTLVAYSTAGSLAALKKRAVLMPAALATLSLVARL